MTAKLTPHHTAGLLGTTRVGDTVDCPSSAITATQALTFLTIPELFATLPIASLVIASTGCWRHTLVAIKDKTIITLAPILAHSVTDEREREAGAGGRTRGSAEFIMAVSRAALLYRKTNKLIQKRSLRICIPYPKSKTRESAYHSQLHSSSVREQHPSVDTSVHNLAGPRKALMLDLLSLQLSPHI